MATCGISAEPCMHREFTRSLMQSGWLRAVVVHGAVQGTACARTGMQT